MSNRRTDRRGVHKKAPLPGVITGKAALGPAQTLEALRERLSSGTPPPSEEPKTLSVEDLGLAPGVFQPRDLLMRLAQDAEHMEVLTRALERGEELDPITVWWDGKGWLVVDGHHRREAYDRMRKGPLKVQVFSGTLEEAMAESVRLNSKNKLPMTMHDKTNTAWRLVCVSKERSDGRGLSRNEISRVSGVGRTTVGNMRRTYEALMGRSRDANAKPLVDLTWFQAQQEENGNEVKGAEAIEAQNQKAALKIAQAITRKVGPGWMRKTGVAAKVIIILDDTAPERLIDSDEWTTHRERMLEVYGRRAEYDKRIGETHPGRAEEWLARLEEDEET